jgi:glycosyltransferase involved in cell wall biosynthesis
VTAALHQWHHVWVVIDGSTDRGEEILAALSDRENGLRVLSRERNGGKGAAVLDGLRAAALAGFTHVLVMDADGQHPADAIGAFIALSNQHPKAMILGKPIFGRDAPLARVIWRQVSNILTRIETLSGIGDSLFGFRVYPLHALLTIMESSPRMRRFDFDIEAVVRLSWSGVPALNRAVPVRYFRVGEGGVSHFHYGRDNVILGLMHARLLGEFAVRLPRLLANRFKSSRH